METDNSNEVWNLRLYITGMTPAARNAIINLEEICENYLEAGKYFIEVIDLQEDPELAQKDQIFAVPTLVRKLPPPIRKVIGDLSNTEKVLLGLNIRPRK